MRGKTSKAGSVSMVPGGSECLHSLCCAIIVDLNRTVAVVALKFKTLPDEVHAAPRSMGVQK